MLRRWWRAVNFVGEVYANMFLAWIFAWLVIGVVLFLIGCKETHPILRDAGACRPVTLGGTFIIGYKCDEEQKRR